jgi:hypothetical protein
MTTRLKHTDDDGDLSIFVSGDEVLFACNHGHAWTAQVSIQIHARQPDHTHAPCPHEDSRPASALVEQTTSVDEPHRRQTGPDPPTHGAA